MEPAARNHIHLALFQAWRIERGVKPTWSIPKDNSFMVLLDSLIFMTTHTGAPSEPATLARLIWTRNNFARAAANVPALTLASALAAKLIVTIDWAALDLGCTGVIRLRREDYEPLCDRLLVALESMVSQCGSPAWEFEVIVDASCASDLEPTSEAAKAPHSLITLLSAGLAARGLACCRIVVPDGAPASEAAARLALGDPLHRVLVSREREPARDAWVTLGASAVVLPRPGDPKGKVALIENRATALMTWDSRAPSSYDAAVLCGGGRSSLHSPETCFMFHFAAGEGMPGVYAFTDVLCDACGSQLGPAAFHDYLFCLPCNWAACGPCVRAADETARAGERAPPPVITRIAIPDGDGAARGSVEACAACGAGSGAGGAPLKRCGRCRGVSYCGPECQRKHWREHRVSCAGQ